jgi:trans-2,3-dihydro-3-hydroxyanthranilate isomerase
MAAGPLAISWLDVFTDRLFGGNPLAVVHDADALSDAQMHALTREIGLSETVFVREDARALRIFTPALEVPLAGHPVVGATIDLARLGRIPAEGRHVFRTGVGATPVEVAAGFATMTQGDPEIGPELPAADIAPLLGLAARDLVGLPVAASTGVRFVFARVRDRATLARVRADVDAIAAIDDPALGLVAWCETGDGSASQRMFGPRFGIPEDPATGVAAGALAALRVAQGAAPGPLLVSQGEELGRPSRIECAVGGAPGSPREVRVGGRATLVLEGALAPGVP